MISRQIKDRATAAFIDNTQLKQMTPEERELAAQFYELVADHTVGTRAELAKLYNLERARFLRGEVDYIAPIALKFAEERGLKV